MTTKTSVKPTTDTSIKRLPPRSEIALEDTWDLSSLYGSDEQWEEALEQFSKQINRYSEFQGQLSDDAQTLKACLTLDLAIEQEGERVGTYAFLRTTEDQANSDYQGMFSRFQNIASQAAQAASFIRPEILAIDPAVMDTLLGDPELAGERLLLERIVRYRPHTLGENEERLLAMQSEMSQAARKAFSQLHNADMKFGLVTNEKGEQVELSNSSFIELLHSPDRDVRKTAFQQYYQQFEAHENTLAATLGGSIQKDVYYAKARGHESSLAAALFPDNMPQSVYDNLISSVRNKLPVLHEYYDLRRRTMELDDIHHYDTYVPILSDLEIRRSWDEAVELVIRSLEPLGSDYTSVLEEGLRGRWCDRYPNQGKQSGAFSCGSFDGDPYILMNYKPDVLNDTFTLTHEAGHSMHSYYSSGNQPFAYYDYMIFVAEVASTFNEQLLADHLLKNAADDRERAYLLNRLVDDIRGTILRQTMFAEFEKVTHEMAEDGEPLTVKSLRGAYGSLLQDYFGPDFVIDDELPLECFRIPHFYRAFYVYKYATGLSAAITLSRQVLAGGQQELDKYLGFLKGGCSKDPLDLLRDAGVDMEEPQAVETALDHFEQLVKELGELL
ncbi:MAG: oligoendopeptidase F [Planctomycetota bacterium]|nr:oligoendopeptidase F [Planctomycetota bacterium]